MARQERPEVEKRKHGTRLPGLPEVTGFGHALRHRTTEFAPHTHPGDLEIVYIARGELCWWAGRERVTLRAGEVYLTFPDEPHGSRDDLCEPGEIYWFTLECAPWRGWCGLQKQPAERLRDALLSLRRRHFPASALLKAIFLQLDTSFTALRSDPTPVDCGGANQTLADQTAAMLAAGLWEIVASSRSADALPQVSPEIARVLEWIGAHLDGRAGVAGMARCAGLSESFFKERFRAETGMSPGKYYLRRRVQAAAEAIRQGRGTLVSIALDYGFSSSQYLTTCLKRETGRTPSQLRAQAAEARHAQPGQKGKVRD